MDGRALAVLALAVVAAALATGNTLLVRLAYALCAVLVVAAVVTWNSIRWVEISRNTRARRSQVGGLAEETFRVRNRGWLPKLWLEVRDESDLPGHHAGRVVSALGSGHSRTWSLRTRCRRRGMFRLGPVTLAGGDPLGLFRLERELAQTAPFIVYPSTLPLHGLEQPTGYLAGGQVIHRRAQFATANVRSVRAYQPGDAFNRIHWPTTARRGRLYTKEFELDPIADLWVMIDLDRRDHVGVTPDADVDGAVLPWLEEDKLELEPTTEEYAITAAASLARHFIDQGKSVGLIAYGQRRVVIQPDRGERQLTKLLTSLAILRATGRTGLAQALSDESTEFTRHTTLIIVTPTTTLRWIEALRELRHRGVGSLVVLLEANTFGAAGSSAGVISSLMAHDILVRVVRCGDDLTLALSG